MHKRDIFSEEDLHVDLRHVDKNKEDFRLENEKKVKSIKSRRRLSSHWDIKSNTKAT